MKRVLVAGATGYLGRYIVSELKDQGYFVRALARNPKKLDDLSDQIDEVVIGEVTQPSSLADVCKGIDAVISTVGITQQKDGLTYEDVDYAGNRNLLDQALTDGVQKFIYVSVINAHLMRDLKVVQAKERFVSDLQTSGIKHTVVRPTGFFSDMLEFLEMAKKGPVKIFGDGRNFMNPIHGADLAKVCVAALINECSEINAGGPEIFSYREIGMMAFRALGKLPKLSFFPKRLLKFSLFLARTFTSPKTYGPFEFMVTVMTMDNIGEKCGIRHLFDSYEAATKTI
jgi:uncharacterized protein YbjT (DUF2867 family)